MVWDGFRLWMVRFAMVATIIGMFVFLINSGGLWHRDLAVILGFGEYNGMIMWMSVTLFVGGLIVLSILDPEEDE